MAAAPLAAAQTDDKPKEPTKLQSTVDEGGRIVTQPARDVGAQKQEIPEILVEASDDPYDLDGARSCTEIAASVKALNGVLGQDFSSGAQAKKENRAGRLAAAGGKTVVNAFIPFRGLVREISGAAPAERRMEAAVNAGIARRGFLRGLHSARKCKTRF